MSRMKTLESVARSSQAKTHAVMIPSKSTARGGEERPKSTSPWPMSRCWCTRPSEPGGLTM